MLPEPSKLTPGHAKQLKLSWVSGKNELWQAAVRESSEVALCGRVRVRGKLAHFVVERAVGLAVELAEAGSQIQVQEWGPEGGLWVGHKVSLGEGAVSNAPGKPICKEWA